MVRIEHARIWHGACGRCRGHDQREGDRKSLHCVTPYCSMCVITTPPGLSLTFSSVRAPGTDVASMYAENGWRATSCPVFVFTTTSVQCASYRLGTPISALT